MKQANRLRAEDRLATLAAVNRGMSGGAAYRKLARSLVRQAGLKDAS